MLLGLVSHLRSQPHQGWRHQRGFSTRPHPHPRYPLENRARLRPIHTEHIFSYRWRTRKSYPRW